MTQPTIAYVIGVYNEACDLAGTVERIASRLHAIPRSEIILVENGSTDGSQEIVKQLAVDYSRDGLTVRAETTPKGLGYALRRGIAVARADRVLLTAADLPFGFSDLDAMLALSALPDVAIGSKAHPQSVAAVTRGRNVMSAGFRVARRLLFGLDLGDTQGSLNVERGLAQRLLPLLDSTGYFISTEIVVLAAMAGATIAEVPVDYSCPRQDSKVRPLHDSAEVLGAMLRLRRRRSHLREAVGGLGGDATA